MSLHHITIVQEIEGRTVVPEISQLSPNEHVDASRKVSATLKEMREIYNGSYQVDKAIFRCEPYAGKVWYRIDLQVIAHDEEIARR